MGLFVVFLFGSVEMFIIIRLESSEIRKIPVIFLPFLNPNNINPGYISFEEMSIVPFFVTWTPGL